LSIIRFPSVLTGVADDGVINTVAVVLVLVLVVLVLAIAVVHAVDAVVVHAVHDY
jgi:hypothetical protein